MHAAHTLSSSLPARIQLAIALFTYSQAEPDFIYSCDVNCKYKANSNCRIFTITISPRMAPANHVTDFDAAKAKYTFGCSRTAKTT